MSIDRLISALHGVRGGPNSWIARCPAHEDRHPSLSIRSLEDGRILIHCFAGCSANSVVSSVGMCLADLMPPCPRDTPDGPGGLSSLRTSWHVNHLPGALRHEALILSLFIGAVKRADDFLLDDLDRADLAAQRILDALGGTP